MTEAQWLACNDPWDMLLFLHGVASDRKLRLGAAAYCRLVWALLGKASRTAVLLGEQMADESVDQGHRDAVVRAAIASVCRFEEARGDFFMAADIAYRAPCNDGWYAAEWTIGNWCDLPGGRRIIEEIVGNPFRPVALEPAWRTANVTGLAEAIYAERAYDRLPILADALEDAGCTSAEVLDHCRQPGEHVRGCWVVDLVLGKE